MKTDTDVNSMYAGIPNGIRLLLLNSTYGKFGTEQEPLDRLLERAGKDRIWRTADGRECPISRMSSDHIRNALGMIQGSIRVRDGAVVMWRGRYYLRLKYELRARAERANHPGPEGESRCNAGRPPARPDWERM